MSTLLLNQPLPELGFCLLLRQLPKLRTGSRGSWDQPVPTEMW